MGVASPLLELVFRTFDPAKMAQRLVHVFAEWHKRSQIDRASAQAMLRTYRARSRKLRSDYSFGAADAMARVLGLTSVDLEAWGEVAYESPPLGEGRAAGGDGGGDAPPSSAGSTTSSGSGSNSISTSSTSGVSGSDAYQAEMARLRSALEGSAVALPVGARAAGLRDRLHDQPDGRGQHPFVGLVAPERDGGPPHGGGGAEQPADEPRRGPAPLRRVRFCVCDARDNVMVTTMDRSERYGMMRA